MGGTGADWPIAGTDDRPQKICNGGKMDCWILRPAGLSTSDPAGVTYDYLYQLYHFCYLYPTDVSLPDDRIVDAEMHSFTIPDCGVTTDTYSSEADCGYFRDAAVFSCHPGGDRPHSGCDEAAEYPGAQPLGVYGPLMVSATETAEELSAAAVTRGIENPARKTSAVSLRLMPADLTGMLLVLALLIGSFVVQ